MARIDTNVLDELDPDLALRPGIFDAHAVLFLWLVRKSFFPTIWLGLSIATIAYGDLESLDQQLAAFDSPQNMVSSLLSPLGVLVFAVGVRIVANLVALGAAYPLTLRARPHHYQTGTRVSRRFHLWWDRLYQARAYRSLRLTYSVRERARSRLEASGRIYRIAEFVLSWANLVFFIAMFIVLATVVEPQT